MHDALKSEWRGRRFLQPLLALGKSARGWGRAILEGAGLFVPAGWREATEEIGASGTSKGGGFMPVVWAGSLLPSAAHMTLAEEHRLLILCEDDGAAFAPPSPEDSVLVRVLGQARPYSPIRGPYADVLRCQLQVPPRDGAQDASRSNVGHGITKAEATRLHLLLQPHIQKFLVVHCQRGDLGASVALAIFLLRLRGDDAGERLIYANPELWPLDAWMLTALEDAATTVGERAPTPSEVRWAE